MDLPLLSSPNCIVICSIVLVCLSLWNGRSGNLQQTELVYRPRLIPHSQIVYMKLTLLGELRRSLYHLQYILIW